MKGVRANAPLLGLFLCGLSSFYSFLVLVPLFAICYVHDVFLFCVVRVAFRSF